MPGAEHNAKYGSKHSIAKLCFAIAVSLACIASVLVVSEKGQGEPLNHWQALARTAAEPRFDSIKSALAKQHFDTEMLPAARELGSIYRQLGKQEEAAKIYRVLWLVPQQPDNFVRDALELASLYSDMTAFPYAIDSYKKILEFDRKRLTTNHPDIVRDLNNLGVCYRCYAVSSSDVQKRQDNLKLAELHLSEAAKIGSKSRSFSTEQETVSVNKKVISINQKVISHDCGILK
ncbi:MAG: hypothetical protein WCT03_25325 [Candidatus Obscuribacterales bacterium]|jgi:tetratricopeptide (TPR) repeat protein